MLRKYFSAFLIVWLDSEHTCWEFCRKRNVFDFFYLYCFLELKKWKFKKFEIFHLKIFNYFSILKYLENSRKRFFSERFQLFWKRFCSERFQLFWKIFFDNNFWKYFLKKCFENIFWKFVLKTFFEKLFFLIFFENVFWKYFL